MSDTSIHVTIWETPGERDCWEATARRDGLEGWGCAEAPDEAAAAAVKMLLEDPSHVGRPSVRPA